MTGVSPAIKPGLPAQAAVLAMKAHTYTLSFVTVWARFLNWSAPGKCGGVLCCSPDTPHFI